MIHLWLFPLLTILIIIFPIITKPKTKKDNLKDYFTVPKTNSESNNFFEKIHFLLSVFEYLFQNNFALRFFWSTGFISWIIGCLFWILNIEFFSSLLLAASIILCIVVLYDVAKLNIEYFSTLEVSQVGFSVYLLIFSVSILVMVSLNSLAAGITTNLVLLAFTPHLRMLKNPTKNPIIK